MIPSGGGWALVPQGEHTLLVRPDGYVAWAGPADGDWRPAYQRWTGSNAAVHVAAA
jgi:hypothetical protein